VRAVAIVPYDNEGVTAFSQAEKSLHRADVNDSPLRRLADAHARSRAERAVTPAGH
jgi:hypothetical protein